MQNLPVPHLKTNAIFYARQLWHCVIGVHDLATSSKASMYTYHETIGKKGQNDVTSLLLDYLKNIKDDLKEEIILISDGCPGQNKNF